MKILVILILILVLSSCVPFNQQGITTTVESDTVIPEQQIIQSTTGIMQYDYKAGNPNTFSEVYHTEERSPNPYLVPEIYKPIPDYFKPLKQAVPITYWIQRLGD